MLDCMTAGPARGPQDPNLAAQQHSHLCSISLLGALAFDGSLPVEVPVAVAVHNVWGAVAAKHHPQRLAARIGLS
jgi:hypothetical protein